MVLRAYLLVTRLLNSLLHGKKSNASGLRAPRLSQGSNGALQKPNPMQQPPATRGALQYCQ